MTTQHNLFFQNTHQRLNILTGEWVLNSPHRALRPWQGKQEQVPDKQDITYDPNCYLCPSNKRADGSNNPDYKKPYAFTNDFSALVENQNIEKQFQDQLLHAQNVQGICRVVCFSPDHQKTLATLNIAEIIDIIDLWKLEFETLRKHEWIKYIQIFENKGEIMGCSNPHPHGQIWAQNMLPNELQKEDLQQKKYYDIHKKTLLTNYLQQELTLNQRIIFSNKNFVCMVPFWAIWPYELIIISRQPHAYISDFDTQTKNDFAHILSQTTRVYDKIFNTSFPYSAGIHQAPVNTADTQHWHWHMHFYPPLLRSASIKKFMVGYEMLCMPQRDISPETAANKLKDIAQQL